MFTFVVKCKIMENQIAESKITHKERMPVGGKKTLYFCRYCKRDITQTCRIKCAVCENVELCTDCFCAGANFENHENSHAYQVSDCLDFPIFCADWSAGEELLLLEGTYISRKHSYCRNASDAWTDAQGSRDTARGTGGSCPSTSAARARSRWRTTTGTGTSGCTASRSPPRPSVATGRCPPPSSSTRFRTKIKDGF